MNSASDFAGTEGCNDYDAGLTRETRDGRDIANEIETQLFIERSVDEVRRLCNEEKRVTVRDGFGDGLRGNIGAGAGRFSTTNC